MSALSGFVIFSRASDIRPAPTEAARGVARDRCEIKTAEDSVVEPDFDWTGSQQAATGIENLRHSSGIRSRSRSPRLILFSLNS